MVLVVAVPVLVVLVAVLIASSVLLGDQTMRHARRVAFNDAVNLVDVLRRAEEVRRRVTSALAQRKPATPAPTPAPVSIPDSPPSLGQGLGLMQTSAFPVDAVFTWVDGADENWRRAVAAARRATGATHHVKHRDPFKPSRFRCEHVRDELFYSAQLVRAYLPWLRQIVIVTQRPHVPWWVEAANAETDVDVDADTHTHTHTRAPRRPRFVVVHHDEFFGPGAVQPTFNSNVIESQLARLPMLAEHFVSFNDDTFVGRPLPRHCFFTDDGKPVLRMHPKPSQCVIHGHNPAWAQHLVNMNMVCNTLGLACGIPIHQALPLRKSVLASVTDVLAPVLAEMQPLRSPHDFPVVYIAASATPWAALPDAVRSNVYNSGNAFARDAEASTLPHLFCINANFNTARAHAVLTRMLQQVDAHRYTE